MRRPVSTALGTLSLVAWTLTCPEVSGQWLTYSSAGIPRTADGKADFRAAAPRSPNGKPDFSGMWRAADPLPCDGINRVCTDLAVSRQFYNFGFALEGGPPYQAWVADRIKAKGPTDDPYVRCIAPGGPRMHLLPTMKKVIQTDSLLVILDEYNANYRQIFLDGRPLPEDPQPTWNGYSTAHWEGDTLVVDSAGFRDDQWLDSAGSALTSAARVRERFRRLNFGRMEIEVTIDDPKAYTKTWTATIEQDAVVDTEMLDAFCLENEKDIAHLKIK